MAVAVWVLTLLACLVGAQAQIAGQSCTIANQTPWPVPGSMTNYFMCVDGNTVQMSCPPNTLFIANNANVFGCVPMGSITCQYNPGGGGWLNNNNYWDNNNNNYYPYYSNGYYPYGNGYSYGDGYNYNNGYYGGYGYGYNNGYYGNYPPYGNNMYPNAIASNGDAIIIPVKK